MRASIASPAGQLAPVSSLLASTPAGPSAGGVAHTPRRGGSTAAGSHLGPRIRELSVRILGVDAPGGRVWLHDRAIDPLGVPFAGLGCEPDRVINGPADQVSRPEVLAGAGAARRPSASGPTLLIGSETS